MLPNRHLAATADEMDLFQWLDERGDTCGAPVGSHDDAVASWLLCAKSFHSAGDGEGRAVVQGVDDRIPERVTQPQVPPPAARPKTAAQLEAERMVRALHPKAPTHDDGEPNRPGTQQPGRTRFSSGIWAPS